MNSNKVACTIHGSYRKNLEVIRQVAELLSFVGAEILCPASFNVKSEDNGFVMFDNDSGTPEEIELSLLETIRINNNNPNFFAYFVNIDGYLGASASYELALAKELGVNYYLLEQPSNVPIKLELSRIVRPIEVAKKILLSSKL